MLCGYRSQGEPLGDDEFTTAHSGYLSVLRLLLQGAGAQAHGEQKTLQPQAHPHRLQLHTDCVQHVDILRGKCLPYH